MGETRNIYKMLAEKPQGKKRLLIRPTRRWEDDIRMDVKEIGYEVVDCNHMHPHGVQSRPLSAR
jgi:hypothetical protein